MDFLLILLFRQGVKKGVWFGTLCTSSDGKWEGGFRVRAVYSNCYLFCY